jgi:PST family polysaccharide transporter
MSRGVRIPGGVASLFLAQAWRQAAQFVTLLVVARILGPAEMGLFGMAAVVSNFLLQFKDLGLGAALIHHRDNDETTLSSAFWALCSIGLVAGTLAGLSLAFIFAGPGIVPQSLLEQTLSFRKVAAVESVAVTIGCAIGVAMAIAGRGVMSLVVQTVMVSAVTSIGMFIARRWRPRLRFSWDSLRHLATFGLDVSGFTMVNYWVRNVDNLLIGRVLGSTALGAYSLAYRMMLWPVQNLSNVVGRLAFPSFVQLRDEPERLASAYLTTLRLIATVVFPVMAIAMALAKPLVLGVLGSRWGAVIVPFAVLAPVGMLQSVGTTVGQLFQATGNTRIQLWWAVLTAPVYIGSFVLGMRWGINGVALAYAIVTTVLFVPGMWLGGRCIGLGIQRLLGVLVVPTIMAGFVGATAWLASLPLVGFGDIWIAAIAGCLGAAAWLLAVRLLIPDAYSKLRAVMSLQSTSFGDAV